MEVEVLGVLHNVNGPKGDVILVRLHGQKVEYTGRGSGHERQPGNIHRMGSWLGRWRSALANFLKRPIAGVRRSPDMLEINALDRSPAEESAAVKPTVNTVAGKNRHARRGLRAARSERDSTGSGFANYFETDRDAAGVQRILPRGHSAFCGPAWICRNRASDGAGSVSNDKQPEPVGSRIRDQRKFWCAAIWHIEATCTVTTSIHSALLACGTSAAAVRFRRSAHEQG